MSDDLLSRLRAARSDEERDWLMTESLLEGLPDDLRQAAWAAAVPHWFDAEILAALLEKPLDEAADLYARLQTLPFVEPFQARGGHNVHEVTRAAMLDHLWRQRREQYLALSARAADCFAGREEPEWRIEQVYHLLLADPEEGANRLGWQGWTWHNDPLFAYNLIYALTEAALEHVAAGRLEGRGAGYAYLLSGVIDTLYSRNKEAIRKLEAARQASGADNQLKADSLLRLGHVHLRLSEYGAARERYEEARPIYAEIGDRLGEANCIQALGDVHRMLAEYGAARERYEEARPIYAEIGARLGEANCDLGLGDVAKAQEDWPQAERLFQAALAVYRETGMPFNAGLALRRLGGVAEGKGEPAEAIRIYQEALEIFERIGVKVAEDTRADLERLRAQQDP